MQGRRLYCDDDGRFYTDPGKTQATDLRDGDYWHYGPFGWAAKCPAGLRCGLRNHRVTEHDDGTVTVSPSIVVSNGEGGEVWHGFLERGIWRGC